jgi:hypothetical protein
MVVKIIKANYRIKVIARSYSEWLTMRKVIRATKRFKEIEPYSLRSVVVLY